MIHVVMICVTWKNMSYNKPSVENKMYGTKLTQLNVCPFNLNAWRMQFLTSTYFWSCRKVSISTSPQRRIVAQNWGWRVNSRTRSVTGHPEEHLPSPPTPLLVVLWGVGIIICESDSACVALELIDLLTFEKILLKNA